MISLGVRPLDTTEVKSHSRESLLELGALYYLGKSRVYFASRLTSRTGSPIFEVGNLVPVGNRPAAVAFQADCSLFLNDC